MGSSNGNDCMPLAQSHYPNLSGLPHFQGCQEWAAIHEIADDYSHNRGDVVHQNGSRVFPHCSGRLQGGSEDSRRGNDDQEGGYKQSLLLIEQ